MNFQTLAIVGDAQAVRDVFVVCALSWRFRLGQLATPLNRYHLPSRRGTLPDDFGIKGTGDHVANPFEMCHMSLPWRWAIRLPSRAAANPAKVLLLQK